MMNPAMSALNQMPKMSAVFKHAFEDTSKGNCSSDFGSSIMSVWSGKREMLGDEPPFLAVGTEVSAKYKGAFCEAKIRKVVRSVKCKVLYRGGLGFNTVSDDQIKGLLRVGTAVEVKNLERNQYLPATITKIQDCSQYTVVFDDGDITTLRRTALCLKSGRHFAESETLDQLPLTHPEHFGIPVIGGRRGRRNRTGVEGSSDDDESLTRGPELTIQKEEDIGRVVCVEGPEKRKQKDNWFPGLVVAPTAQDTVEIYVKDEYLVRSFKDGRYYTVPKNEATEFTREIGAKVDNHALKSAVDKALLFLDRGELPPHWDRELLLYGLNDTGSDSDEGDCESSDDEPREEKDHFVAQLYKFMDDSGTPINKGPTISSKDVDLYRLFKVVQNLGGYNRVTNTNNWKTISHKMGFGHNALTVSLVKQSYKKFLYSFEEFYRKLGCTMINHPRLSRNRSRSGRSLIRDRDRAAPTLVKTEDAKLGVKIPGVVVQPSTSTAPDVSDIKTEEEFTPLPKLTLEPPIKTYPTLKEKLLPKKAVLDVTHFPIKIKEEKKEEIKVEIKENKKDVKTKQNKSKNVDDQSPKPESNKDKDVTPKEKKKKIFSRVPVKKEKPKTQSVAKPVSSLACTRQKRALKEQVSCTVDHFKVKGVKYGTPLIISDSTDKTVVSRQNKNKEEVITSPNSKPNKKEKDDIPVKSVEDKKKGRKRKECRDTTDESTDSQNPVKVIAVGDRLKVYYGPTHESKVTYEAKVLNVREENGEKLYLVHYTGWNTRYDEWIKVGRIADNLSLPPTRSAKKSLQAPKVKKKKTQKTESASSSRGDLSSSSSCSISHTKEQNPVRQGSVGRCTTPSSISSLSSRKNTKTRSYTRSNKRELSASETDHESESDYAEVESLSKKADTPEEISSEKKRKKRKSESSDVKDIKSEPKTDDNEDNAIFSSRRFRKSSIDKVANKDHLEEDITDEQIKAVSNEKDLPLKKEAVDGPSDGKLAEPKSSSLPRDIKKEDDSIISHLYTNLCQRDQSEKILLSSPEESSKGRDFDLTQIRSELKGIGTAVSDGNKGQSSESTETKDVSVKVDEADDIYEFKEPEPFEFEVRKSMEEKNKSRRNIGGRLFDENKSLSKSLAVPPAPSVSVKSKSPSSSPSESPKKEDTSFESLPTIHTCEETFDKICASPLRAAIEHRIFDEPLENSDDDFDDDSQDRLFISERDSDNISNLSNEKDVDCSSENVDLPPHSSLTFKKNLLKYDSSKTETKTSITSKEDVEDEEDDDDDDDDADVEEEDDEDDDDDEEEEDEDDDDDDDDVDVDNEDDDDEDLAIKAINVAIQAIAQDSSDDTNDDLFSKITPITTIPQKTENKCEMDQAPPSHPIDHEFTSPHQVNISNVTISNETDSEKIFSSKDGEDMSEPTPEAAKKEETFKLKDAQLTDSKDDFEGFSDIDNVEMDTDEVEVEIEVEQENQEVDINDDLHGNEPKESKASTHCGSIITKAPCTPPAVEEEPEENNIDALLCQETIPSSPNPQTDTEMYHVQKRTSLRRPSVEIGSKEQKLKLEIIKSEPTKRSARLGNKTPPRVGSKTPPRLGNKTPPTTPNSPGSSLASPRSNEILLPQLDNENKLQQDFELEMDVTKKELLEVIPKSTFESRIMKKSEGGRKKGRRPRKRSDESTKRKHSRGNRHHGSDTDENLETVGHHTWQDTRSPYLNKYNFTPLLSPSHTSSQRISLLQQALQEIRKTYADIKNELAMVDRRRKKLRRREKENAIASSTNALTSSGNGRFH